MKKILLSGIITFGLFSTSYAYNNTFIEPEISYLPGTEIIGTAVSSDFIRDNTDSMNRFCASLGGTYVSHTSISHTSVAEYVGNQWDNSSSTTSVGDLVCDLPPPTTSVAGGLSISWTGDTGARDYLQLTAIKDGEIFINQDTYFYLFCISLTAVFIFRMFISFLMWSFASGFYISSGTKILGRK